MHIMAERGWNRACGTVRRSRFQGECFRPDSVIFPNWRKRSESNAYIPKDGPLRVGVGSPDAQRFQKKMMSMRGLEPKNPGLHRATGFPDQLLKPPTHLTRKQNNGKYLNEAHGTAKGIPREECDALDHSTNFPY